MTLVIMAAGMGSRFGGLKQIEPVGPSGEFIVDYSIYDAIQAGFKKVVFIIKEENLELFKETVGNRVSEKIEVEYVFQKITDIPNTDKIPASRVKPWGTAHAVLTAKKAVADDFVVINADDFYGRDPFIKIRKFFDRVQDETKNHYCMVGYKAKNTLSENGYVSRGICKMDGQNMLISISECKLETKEDGIVKTDEAGNQELLDPNTLVSMNFWGFTPNFFGFIEGGIKEFFEQDIAVLEKAEYYLPTAVQESINQGVSDVEVLGTDNKWYGITYKEDKSELTNAIDQMVEEGIYPSNLWKN